jgi:hypothetical protein
LPTKTETPLIIDSDAELAGTSCGTPWHPATAAS